MFRTNHVKTITEDTVIYSIIVVNILVTIRWSNSFYVKSNKCHGHTHKIVNNMFSKLIYYITDIDCIT